MKGLKSFALASGRALSLGFRFESVGWLLGGDYAGSGHVDRDGWVGALAGGFMLVLLTCAVHLGLAMGEGY